MAKRLIDSAELIAKLPVVEEDKQISLIGAVADVVTMISECKPVDAVEVCYCKDCKHCIAEKLLCVHPRNRVFGTGISVCLNHFCSYGERTGGQAPQREDV